MEVVYFYFVYFYFVYFYHLHSTLLHGLCCHMPYESGSVYKIFGSNRNWTEDPLHQSKTLTTVPHYLGT